MKARVIAGVIALSLAVPQAHAKWSVKKKVAVVATAVVAAAGTTILLSMRNNGWYNKFCGTLPGPPPMGSPGYKPDPGPPPYPRYQYGGGCK